MNNKLVGKFLKGFFIVFVSLLVVISIATYTASLISKSNISTQIKTSDFSNTASEKKNNTDPLEDKKLTTIAVFGRVGGGDDRTDVNMLVFFNHESYKIDIINIPEDTRMKIPDEIYEKIIKNKAGVDQIVKLNEVPTLADRKKNEASVAVLEKSLGVDIDYYINIDMEAFRKAVDIVGEIPINIPAKMEYTDNKQQLHINLEKGENSLNGARAEQLVRFISGYSDGEMGRINMQQVFMKSFVRQLLSTKNRVNMINILSEAIRYVQTDFVNIVDYLVFLDKINESSFRYHILPGHKETTARGYYIYDLEATKSLIGRVINSEEIRPELIIDVKELPISIQNGTNIKGLASRTADKLKNLGYKVEEITNYTENNIVRSKIIVENEIVFKQVAPYFKDPEMVVNEQLHGEYYQVIIVLGKNDADK